MRSALTFSMNKVNWIFYILSYFALYKQKARLELLIFGRSSHGTDPFSRQRYLASIMEKIKDEISYQLSDDEEAASIGDTVCKDRSMCSAEELEKIRRERNRVHAKKTRLKKRKMCIEMEQVLFNCCFYEHKREKLLHCYCYRR